MKHTAIIRHQDIIMMTVSYSEYIRCDITCSSTDCVSECIPSRRCCREQINWKCIQINHSLTHCKENTVEQNHRFTTPHGYSTGSSSGNHFISNRLQSPIIILLIDHLSNFGYFLCSIDKLNNSKISRHWDHFIT